MKVLIIEDIKEKKDAIKECILDTLCGDRKKIDFIYAPSLIEAIREMNKHKSDLIVFDMYLPSSSSDPTPIDCSQQLIMEFTQSSSYQSEAIALTGVDIQQIDDMRAFNQVGVTLVKYDKSGEWKKALASKVTRVAQKPREDFLIFTALASEREGFRDADCKLGDTKNIYGMDCQEIEIGVSKGLIIKPRHMGLVNMAIAVSKSIEIFQPKIVAMSGICAGVSGESNYLDLLVGKVCWEWQTGKWKDGEFRQEPYQRSMSSQLEVDLEQSTQSKLIIDEIRNNLYCSELADMKIRLVPVSSGSAVIADADKMDQIGMQHRKMAGLEMEMYAMYEAAEQSLAKPLFFGAKSVVDMGDKGKSDDYHRPACVTSARYVAMMISKQLDKL